MVGCDLWHGAGFRNGGCRSSPSTPWLSFVNIFMIAMKIRPDHDAGADHDLEDHEIMIDKKISLHLAVAANAGSQDRLSVAGGVAGRVGSGVLHRAPG